MTQYNNAELRAFIKYMINIQLGKVQMFIKMFEGYKNACEDPMKKEGVQDCIDILQESLVTGMSITEDEIYTKANKLEEELKDILVEYGSFNKEEEEENKLQNSLFASKMPGKDSN